MKENIVKNWRQFNEQTSNKMIFNYKDSDFELVYINSDKYRIIDKISRTWAIVKGNDINNALENAKNLIDDVFDNSRPLFFPKRNEKFIVTGEYYDSDDNTTKPIDKLTFRTGTHTKNPTGSGNVYARKGEILTFEHEGEDNDYYYLDGNKKVDKQYYFKYSDGSDRYSVQGAKCWHLLWNKKIKQVL